MTGKFRYASPAIPSSKLAGTKLGQAKSACRKSLSQQVLPPQWLPSIMGTTENSLACGVIATAPSMPPRRVRVELPRHFICARHSLLPQFLGYLRLDTFDAAIQTVGRNNPGKSPDHFVIVVAKQTLLFEDAESSTVALQDQPLRDSKNRKASGFRTVGLDSENVSMPRILRLNEVIGITGLGKTTIYQLQRAGDFPRCVKMTAQAVGWIEDEVRTWITNRMAARTRSQDGQQT